MLSVTSDTRFARHAERGQTLPIWVFSILTALVLMFFLLNYAHIVREQVRAQNAADSMATMMLAQQATQWNKMTAILYASDVEEWRIRSILAGLINASEHNGGCVAGSTCTQVYNQLQPQFVNAVNRYTSDLYALDNFSWIPQLDIQSQAIKTLLFKPACTATPAVSTDCSFKYQLLSYGQRTGLQQVGKDALYVHVGGSFPATYFSATTPTAAWQPPMTDIAACETVQPLVNFSIFGYRPQPVAVVGRAAATVVPVTSEWLVPGTTVNPATGTFFQTTEDYTGLGSPWYETTFPAQTYSVGTDYTFTTAEPDMEVYAAWWGVIPIAPYAGAAPAPSSDCSGYF